MAVLNENATETTVSQSGQSSTPSVRSSGVLNQPRDTVMTFPFDGPSQDDMPKLIEIPSVKALTSELTQADSTEMMPSSPKSIPSTRSLPTIPEDSYPIPSIIYIRHPRTFRGQPVKDKDAHLPDSVLAFKKRRQRFTAVVTWMFALTGFVVLGPFGAATLGRAAYRKSKSMGKAHEERMMDRYSKEQHKLQHTQEKQQLLL